MLDRLILVVGLPFSGKSKFIDDQFKDWTDVISLEEIAYDVANVRDMPITEKTWPQLLKSAQVEYERRLSVLCDCPTGSPMGTIVVEGNFTSYRPRRDFLKRYGVNKAKVAIVMPTPTLLELSHTAIESNKFFSFGGIKNKLESYSYPKTFEGFDIIVDSNDPDLHMKIWE